MPENKKQHYVPRFYLKRFSENDKTINLFNLKSKNKIINASLKGQCYKNYFYGKNLEVEKELAEIEDTAANIFNSISNKNELPKRETDFYMHLFLYTTFQHFRTKYQCLALNESTNAMVKHLLELNPKFTKEMLDKVNIGFDNPVGVSLSMAAEIVIITFDLQLKLLIITNERDEFITSDNPIVMYNQFFEYRRIGSNVGFASKGLQIFFPIDHKHMLIFYDSEIYKVGNKKELIVSVNDVNDINSLNQLQIVNALDNVYYKDKNLKINELYNSSLKYFRKQKTKLTVLHEVNENVNKGELVGISDEVAHTKLQLSIMKVIKKAKKWRIDLKKMKMQPMVVVRNEQRMDDIQEFHELVEKGKYNRGDLPLFLKEKYEFES